MCLAIPGRIESIEAASDPKMGRVDFGGIKKTVCLSFVPEASENDYVLVHVGVALSIVDEQEALETIAMLKQLEYEMDELTKAGDDEIS